MSTLRCLYNLREFTNRMFIQSVKAVKMDRLVTIGLGSPMWHYQKVPQEMTELYAQRTLDRYMYDNIV